jgi:hypothetical protein
MKKLNRFWAFFPIFFILLQGCMTSKLVQQKVIIIQTFAANQYQVFESISDKILVMGKTYDLMPENDIYLNIVPKNEWDRKYLYEFDVDTSKLYKHIKFYQQNYEYHHKYYIRHLKWSDSVPRMRYHYFPNKQVSYYKLTNGNIDSNKIVIAFRAIGNCIIYKKKPKTLCDKNIVTPFVIFYNHHNYEQLTQKQEEIYQLKKIAIDSFLFKQKMSN